MTTLIRLQSLWKRASVCIFLAASFSSLAQAQRPAPAASATANQIRRRQDWFYRQRAFPLSAIPGGAYQRAFQGLDQMIQNEARLRAGRGALNPKSANGAEVAASNTQWTPIGPQPTLTPFAYPISAGRVSALAVDPGNANVVYLGAAQGGVWKTTDGGTNWIPKTDSQTTLAVGSIALDPSNSSIVYVGTGEEVFSGDSYYGAGILKSIDGGSTWTQLGASTFGGPFSTTLGGARIGSIAVHPTNGQIVLAAAQFFSSGVPNGIFRSTDGGTTWTNVLSGAPGTGVVFDGNNAYAALGSIIGNANNGVYKSTDGGANWARADAAGATKLPTTDVGRIALAIAPSSPLTLYAGIQNSGTNFGDLLGLFKSVDGGVNWTQVTTNPDYCTPQCWYDNVIRVAPTNASAVYLGGSAGPGNLTSLFRSLDGGTTWTNITSGANGVILHVDHHALAFSGDSTKFFAGNDGGVWSTTDMTGASVNWTNLNNTLSITQFYGGLSIHPTDVNTSFAGTQDNGIQKYTGGLAWNYSTCGDGGWSAFDSVQPSTVYAACQDIDIRKSTTGGASWSSAVNGITNSDRGQFIPPLVVDPSNPLNVYFGTFRVYQSINGAGLWTPISPDLASPSTTANVTTIAVAPSDSNTVYAGTGNSKVQVTTNALAGAGATWTDRSSASLPPRFVTQIAVAPANPLIAYVTFSGFSGFADTKGHVFKTTTGGTSWTDISGNLPNTPVNDIVIDPDLANTFYVGTDVGVFRTTDGGVTWSTLVTGLPRVAVFSLKLHRTSRTLRAATHGRGVWDLLVPLPPAPTVTINQAAGQADPANASPINFTAVFSEAVTGFASAGVTITGSAPGTKTVTITGSGTTYNVAVGGMTGSGTVVANVNANAAISAANGRGNAASTFTDNSVTFITVPTVTINQAAAQSDPTTASPINFTAVFSEAVTGFSSAGVAITGTATFGTQTVTVTGGPSTYNVAVGGMTGSGTVIANVNANAATGAISLLGNLASTSTDHTITFNLPQLYLVGDAFPAGSDTAPGFGDGLLNNLDLIYGLRAVTNVPGFTPAPCTDRFDAMDSFPLDAPGVRGGDGVLNNLDLIRTLRRITNVDTSRPTRASRGIAPCPAPPPGSGFVTKSYRKPRRPAETEPADGAANVELGEAEVVEDGVRVPIYLSAGNGIALSSLSFSLGAEGSSAQMRFEAVEGPQPSLVDSGVPGVLAMAWFQGGLSVSAGEKLLLGYAKMGLSEDGSGIPMRVFGADVTRAVSSEANEGETADATIPLASTN